MWGVYPEAIDWKIALRTDILIWASVYEVGLQKHFNKFAYMDRLLGFKSVFFYSRFLPTHPK